MVYKKFEELEDDGYKTKDIGIWGEEKYRIVSHYAALFAQSMSNKWESLVYLDLFAGAGRSRIRDKNRIINASPFLILGLNQKFSQYIFNDSEPENYNALKCRIERDYPEVNVNVICEDINENISKIISVMPKPGKGFRVLGFCFLDPFKMSNLCFSTIQVLSQRYMDFLILIPTGMDAKRNPQNYLRPENNTVKFFLGNDKWRENWKNYNKKTTHFGQFILEEFGQSMGKLGYIVPRHEETIPIKNTKNIIIYRLVLFSKNPLAKKFWIETKKYTNPQTQFDF